jgi:Putative peptidoglycan binding domain
MSDQDKIDEAPLPPWEDMDPTPAQPPAEWLAQPLDFADSDPPPQITRTVNLLPVPEHGLAGPDDLDGIAAFILSRAKEGIGDIFAHDDYNTFSFSGAGEDWARAVAEHQTGIPYTQPAYFYDGGAQGRVAKAIVGGGRLPLAGQCQQSVSSALMIGGWDGGSAGDIGSGLGAQAGAARLGWGQTSVPMDLSKWPDDLWAKVTAGTCFFWSSDSATVSSGHVTMVIRKHPTDRKVQLWDTRTSFEPAAVTPAAALGVRMLFESHWWPWIAPTLSNGAWKFRGIATIDGLGAVKTGLAPRGRCRLLLRRRSDGALLYRTAWMSMETEGLPISWLLRSVRGAPFFDQIEAMWCVNSTTEMQTTNVPDNRPLLDLVCDRKGNATMTWIPTQGLHGRQRTADWTPPSAFGGNAGGAAPTASAPATSAPAASTPAPALDGALVSAPLAADAGLQRIAAKKAPGLAQGAHGPSVKALQEALVKLGYPVAGGADGAFGGGTLGALTQFQSDFGITPDGVAGADTLQALDGKLLTSAP